MKKLLLSLSVLVIALLCGTSWAATQVTSGTKEWTSGEYVADGAVSITERVVASGDVTLTLNDGCILSAVNGITVSADSSLTIRAGGPLGTGRLIATGETQGQDGGTPGIGGAIDHDCGSITIEGGTIIATGGYNGAGIGSSSFTPRISGSGGSGTPQPVKSGTVTITGGTVIATGGDNAAGIGGGFAQAGAVVSIRGGVVDATGNGNGAGIGGGAQGPGGMVMITGGTVDATSGTTNGPGHGDQMLAAGIGGGAGGNGGDVVINGGTVRAVGFTGIGGGDARTVISQGTLTSDENGRAWIEATGVAAGKSGFVRGVIFDGNAGEVYGSPTLTEDAKIPSDATLAIPSGRTLTVECVLTVEGALDLRGKIVNNGTIVLPSKEALDELLESGKLSGSGELIVDGKAYSSDGELAPYAKDAADAETIKTFVVAGAGLDVKNGAVVPDSALEAIEKSSLALSGTADADTIMPLKIVDVKVADGDKFAVLTFEGISGAALVFGDRTVGVDELNIVKLIDNATAKRLTYAKDGAEDASYVVLSNGAPVQSVSSSGANYTLNVFIADNGECDLAKGEKDRVVDPLVLVKSTGGRPNDDPTPHRSGGSGGCTTGASLVALAALAAAAIKRRGR